MPSGGRYFDQGEEAAADLLETPTSGIHSTTTETFDPYNYASNPEGTHVLLRVSESFVGAPVDLSTQRALGKATSIGT